MVVRVHADSLNNPGKQVHLFIPVKEINIQRRDEDSPVQIN